MKPEKKEKLLELIRQGMSWEQACRRSQNGWDYFLDVMADGQKHPNSPNGQIVQEIYQAGKIATEQSLRRLNTTARPVNNTLIATAPHGKGGTYE